MNVKKKWLWFIVVLLSPVLLASEPDGSNSERTAVQKTQVLITDELDKNKDKASEDRIAKDRASKDKASNETADPEKKKKNEQTADKPIFSTNDEFKPSEQVSEDLSIPFPIDI
jgi:hypothetical protein